jgi:hypothetical protein
VIILPRNKNVNGRQILNGRFGDGVANSVFIQREENLVIVTTIQET